MRCDWWQRWGERVPTDVGRLQAAETAGRAYVYTLRREVMTEDKADPFLR